jgi:hypothetical protein
MVEIKNKKAPKKNSKGLRLRYGQREEMVLYILYAASLNGLILYIALLEVLASLAAFPGCIATIPLIICHKVITAPIAAVNAEIKSLAKRGISQTGSVISFVPISVNTEPIETHVKIAFLTQAGKFSILFFVFFVRGQS